MALPGERISGDKSSNPTGSEDALANDVKCPNCGAWESEGGCQNPSVCARALAQKEADYSREMTKLQAQEKAQDEERPAQLLMAGLEALLNVGLAVTTGSGQQEIAKIIPAQQLTAFNTCEAKREQENAKHPGPIAEKQLGPCGGILPAEPESGGHSHEHASSQPSNQYSKLQPTPINRQ